MPLTSKERVRKAVQHQEPDRAPASMNATQWVVERLKTALQVSSDRELLHALHLDLFDMRGITQRSGVMPRYIGPQHSGIPADWRGDILRLWGIEQVVIETEAGKMWSQEVYPLAQAHTLDDLQRYHWPDPDWFDYTRLRTQLQPWTDFAIVCSGGSVFQHPTFLRGLDGLLIDMAVNPAMANYVFDRFTDFYEEFFRRIFEQAGDLIEIFALADDVGTQNTLLISPHMFERFVAPRLKRMADLAHAYDLKLLFHSDGNIRALIPRLIELGVDILDPIQPEARDMDPVAIKHEFGEQLCLRGGVSAQQILAHGAVEEVQAETRRILTHLAPGGGYILSPGHPVLQDDAPTANILAMYDTAFQYGEQTQ
jgi:uroporphyrinogen decarboxylase